MAVYFNELNDGSHFSVNSELKFSLTHYLKIGISTALLKQNENNPGFIDSQIIFKGSSNPSPSGMIINQFYTIKDLIYRMLAENDLCAKELLIPLIEIKVLKNVCDAIQIKIPDAPDKQFELNVVDCSKFFKMFYNSGFLSINDSEFMLQLLTKTKFKNGIIKNIST